MAENQSFAEQNKARLKEITDSIETGIQELFQSDKYRQYLSTMSRFHRYSLNNTMLIYMQKPDASLCAGFNKWKNQFERNVKKGEKGIKIIAPTPYKKKIEEMKLDPDTKAPMLDENGNAIMEEKTVQIPMYKVVSVFDVSQTEGKPLPELAENLTGDVQNYEVFMEALKRSAPVPISFEPMAANTDGYFSISEQRIAIREGMSERLTVAATVHEIAHSKLHNKNLPEVKEQWKLVMVSDGGTKKDYIGGYDTLAEAEAAGEASGWNYVDENRFEWRLEIEEDTSAAEIAKKSRETEEVEAESISFAVCAYYGIKTDENSFGYIATWSKDKELSALRESLETINKTASSLITDIDRNYRDIIKERGLDKVEPAYPMPDPALTAADLRSYGYTETDMLPLSSEKARKLLENDATVYMLHPGNGAEMAFDADDIEHHSGLFGIRREDWEQEREYLELTAGHELTEQELENSFLHNPADAFAIYQLKHTEDTRDLRFEPLAAITAAGLTVAHENYALVYTDSFTKQEGTQDRLAGLWERFNTNLPEDFHHHSLSVSDIVALKQSGNVTYHYVDTFSFAELPNFQKPENYLKAAEMSMEDDYGMIDGIVNNGKAPAVAGLDQQANDRKEKKPSVLAQLKTLQEKEKSNTAPKKSAEREL